METEAELKALRQSLARGTPFCDTHWEKKRLQSSVLSLRFDLEAGQGTRKLECPLLLPSIPRCLLFPANPESAQ